MQYLSEVYPSDAGKYVYTKWKPAMEKYKVIYDILDHWWHPAMVLFLCITPVGALAYLIANIVMMFDYQAQALAIDEFLFY